MQPDVSILDISEDDPNFEMYKNIMEKFRANTEDDEAGKQADAGDKGEVFYDDDDEIPDEDEDADKEAKLSKRRGRRETSSRSQS